MANKPSKLFFIMVGHPSKGWIRSGNAYATKKAADGWTDFVKSYWRGLPTKVERLNLTWNGDKLDDRTIEILDKKFNLDVPANL